MKATIPNLQHNIMKAQLKKAFSDASRQVPTKTEDIIKTVETFLTEERNNMEIQHDYLQDALPSEHELEIQGLSSQVKNLKSFTTKEITKIIHKSIPSK